MLKDYYKPLPKPETIAELQGPIDKAIKVLKRLKACSVDECSQ